MTTIKDIAKATNFSISTVSRVLNHDPSLSVTKDTKKIILETAEKLNYTKHKKKQLLKLQKNQLNIGIIQWLSIEEELEDTYYMSIRIGAETKAKELNFNLTAINLNDDILPDNLSGLLAIGKFSQKEVERITQLHENIVFIGTNYPLNEFNTVHGDFNQAAELAINHLIENGHKDIGIIATENPHNLYGHRKYKSPTIYTFIDYTKSLGLFNESFFFFKHATDPNFVVGQELMNEAIKKKDYVGFPTAFFITNDAMAIGAMKVLSEHNISVPDDVSLIGVNDLSVTEFVTPPLTTIKVYTQEMGKTGVELLNNKIISEENFPRKIVIRTKLIERETVKNITETPNASINE